MRYLTITPAYGRDYKSKKEVLEAWNAGQDFVLEPEGQYISIRDRAHVPGEVELHIRYKKLTNICVVKDWK